MKLPSAIGDLLGKNQTEKELFASLVLDREYVAASLWEIGDKGVPKILAASEAHAAHDSWEARLDAADDALAEVEDKAGTTKYSKVVLGLPLTYLTEAGEIQAVVRPEIKKITHELQLSPIGFVSIHQALIYDLKKSEGVPPSAILLGISDKSLSLSLYKVGVLAGQQEVERVGDLPIQLEEMLKKFTDIEVLPARILLYGRDGKDLEEYKADLLRYPWTTRVSFLHFPKIEIIRPIDLVESVSLAGAGELGQVGADDVAGSGETSSVAQANVEPVRAAPLVTEEAMADASEDTPMTEEELEASVDEEELSAEAEVEAEDIEEAENIQEEESNVVVVDPAKLGFRKNVDVLEHVEPPVKTKRKLTLPKVALPDFSSIPLKIPHMYFPGGKIAPLIVIILVIILLFGTASYFLPHATVTIFETPKTVEAKETITIDPTATVVDAQNKIIPGRKQEKSVSTEKVVPVTGKKKVGDPAKGTVVVYNKVKSPLTLKKGTVLTSGSLSFTLDDDVSVASASQTSIETLTYGKSNAAITAADIGTESNLPSGREFLVKDKSSDSVIARNDQALTGGTSREVTVVTRADYDGFVKTVSEELIAQAKTDLGTTVSDTEKLIDATIKTAVTEKVFAQELDQEATQLSGKLTITVSGISYNEDDIKTLLTAFIAKDIPDGYTLADGRTSVTVEQVTVKKDGKITVNAAIKADAVPTLDIADIQKNLSGKKITDAESYLRDINGIGAVEFRFRTSLSHSRLPMNVKNISIEVAIQ